MSVTVIVPTLLRPVTGGARDVEVDAATVGEAVQAVDMLHPGFAEAVMEQDGSFKRYLSVWLGEDDVRYLRGPATRVPDGSEVVILPAVAGG